MCLVKEKTMKANRMCLSITFVIIFACCGSAGALPRASLRADLMGQPGIAKAYFLFEKAPFE
jgi:hypothetical protein